MIVQSGRYLAWPHFNLVFKLCKLSLCPNFTEVNSTHSKVAFTGIDLLFDFQVLKKCLQILVKHCINEGLNLDLNLRKRSADC